MAVATRLQDRRRRRRALAAASAIVLLFVGFHASNHAAEVAHAHDHLGNIVHAQELAESHEASATPHLHGHAEHHGDLGDCSLLATAHQSTIGSTPADSLAEQPTLATSVASTPAACDTCSIATYRIAPKTSPPVSG